MGLSDAARTVWGKTDRTGLSVVGWLPLWRHLADAADVAGRLWDHWLSPAVRHRIADELPGGDTDGRTLAVWLAGVHDIGKATPAFAVQASFRGQTANLVQRMRDRGLDFDHQQVCDQRRQARHDAAGHLVLAEWLRERDWTDPHAYAVVVGGHHGVPPTDEVLKGILCRRYLLGDQAWQQVQHELLTWMTDRAGAGDRLSGWADARLSQPVQAALTGLVIVADWIASNEKYFPYLLDAADEDRLKTGWEEVDLPVPWLPAQPPADAANLFSTRFALPSGATPRPVQQTVTEVATSMPTPGMIIVEAAMGEGKTEAALAAVEILARRTGASGCYLALPTRATSDAMFSRMLSWLRRLPDTRVGRGDRDVRLAHGKAALNPEYDQLRHTSLASAIAEDDGGTSIGVNSWLAGSKRSLLSSFVVGTVDQLLFAALRGKHLVLRHLGLAGKVVVIDEAHAYDVYMGRFLDRALEWLAAYGVPVVVLSATLPAHRRAELLAAYDNGRLGPPPPLTWRDRGKTRIDPYAAVRTEMRYPLITTSADGRGAITTSCADSGRGIKVRIRRLDDDPTALINLLRDRLRDGGCALVIRNTVARVQQTAEYLRTALGPDLPVSVAHSRFMAVDRATKDRWLAATFGPPGTAERPRRHIVVASQVAEQSLDIDFDLLVTDLAPVDLVLQRIGRLHRHPRDDRPAAVAEPTCWITGADWTTEPPQPVAGSRRVYQPAMLLRSAAVLLPHLDGVPLRLPADIAVLTQAAYGDTEVGPQAWQPALSEAEQKQRDAFVAKELKADGFRLAGVAERGEPLIGWLSGGIGDADDKTARGHVRDTDGETLEVLLLVRTETGLVIPPWIGGGGVAVPVNSMPHWRLARQIARCTLPLPRSMTATDVIDDTIAELERRVDVAAWQDSPWLAGELVLDIEINGLARVGSFDLHYEFHEGLRVSRRD
ncbi:CRISPR-associated helicase/endonuclease Cas3 [Actinoplanes lobatus]|uniref:CRISPR-associated helicase Cas3/CRISPR-associated endonuclease Cas3-HD n=1 Tax=Actinoplanes lobatus TaxID=113568 RepID=A0A7W7MJC9_9ACTN|nr:CRISPR-associated helicase Cas3' [Actinoplanes lobatus]MBB4752522.1 CRISPR-associated helicase Cas3/CRISPR-associated endonuclease Cas3-HD [Actinoplanes lobatus]GGN94000.1 CRISPR-associated helicase/endonuclease Cas3 [Actinoplanes lobatus]GIE44822.1 CRISPR-associated helicase/endonuclease Cas3 [Actinoplanes lobatus]